MTSYDMTTQLWKGQWAEHLFDLHYTENFIIKKVSRADQRKGMDRILTLRADTSQVYRVEYKADWTADSTNNFYLETISVDTENKPGWVYTTQADFLMYYIPPRNLYYVFKADYFRKNIDRWAAIYPTHPTPNHDRVTKKFLFNSHGVCTPIKEVVKGTYGHTGSYPLMWQPMPEDWEGEDDA